VDVLTVARPASKQRRLWFGKYKGMTVNYVIRENPSYIRWLLANNIMNFSLTPPEKEKFEAFAVTHKPRPRERIYLYDDFDPDDPNGPWGISEEDFLGYTPGDKE